MTLYALTTGNPNVVDLRAADGTDVSFSPVNLATGVAIDQLTGDVLAGPGSGSQPATVVKVNGAAVPAAGALTTGNVLQVTGASTLGYAPVNLAGGAAFVTGVLPAGNQAAQAMAGDVTGTTAASVVAKVNGSTVPAGGALTTGNVLQVTGAGALSYAPVNLAGGANFVMGVLPASNQAPQASFVFAPGQAASGNRFATWAALSAAAAAFDPRTPITVLVDDSLAAAHVTVGNWNVDNWTLLVEFNSAGNGILFFDQGATISFSALTVGNTLILQNNSTNPVFTCTQPFALVRLDEGTIQSSTAAPFFQINAGTSEFLVIVDHGSTLGDNVHPAISTSVVAANVLIQLFSNVGQGVQIRNNALAGAGTIVVTFTTPLASMGQTQGVTTLTLTEQTNIVSATGNTGTGGATVSAVTGNISRQRAGKMNVRGYASGTTSLLATVTAQLKRDAANIGTTMQAVSSAAGSFNIPIEFDDTSPDGAAHTYTIAATASSGTITTAASGCFIRVQEQ